MATHHAPSGYRAYLAPPLFLAEDAWGALTTPELVLTGTRSLSRASIVFDGERVALHPASIETVPELFCLFTRTPSRRYF